MRNEMSDKSIEELEEIILEGEERTARKELAFKIMVLRSLARIESRQGDDTLHELLKGMGWLPNEEREN